MAHDRSRRSVASGCLAVVAAAAAMLWPPAPARAQQPGPTVSGRVVDSASGAGIAGAEVTLHGARVVTGPGGEFHLYAPLSGADTLRARRLGFASRALVLRDARPHTVDVSLSVVPRLLAASVVRAIRPRYSGRLAGYYQRLESSVSGQFITRAELDQDQQGLLSHVLQHVPGVQVQRGRGVPIVSMRGRNCRPLIWLDGIAMGAADVDIDAFSPSSLHGVELYLGPVSAPQRYQASRGRSECGTILLWSRGPDTDPVGSGPGSTPAELEKLLGTKDVFTAEQVDVPAVADSGMTVPFPPVLRASGVSGSALVEFVVDTAGRVVESTFGVVAAAHPAFAEAARAALLTAVFRPAQRNARPVRQLVRQRFEFDPASRPARRR